MIIPQNSLLPNKSKKKFRKTDNPNSDTDIIGFISGGEKTILGRFNNNLRIRLNSLLYDNKDLHEPPSLKEIAMFLNILKTRLEYDGIDWNEVLYEMNQYKEKYGSFDKMYQSLQEIEIDKSDAEKIGFLPINSKQYYNYDFRKEMGLNQSEVNKAKKRNLKNGYHKKIDKEIQEMSEVMSTGTGTYLTNRPKNGF